MKVPMIPSPNLLQWEYSAIPEDPFRNFEQSLDESNQYSGLSPVFFAVGIGDLRDLGVFRSEGFPLGENFWHKL